MSCYDDRWRLLAGLHEVDRARLEGRRVLLFDGRVVRKGGRGPAPTRSRRRIAALNVRRFQSAEIIRLAKGGTGAVHRQLARLEDSGLVTVTRSGNQKHYQASRSSPVFEELRGLVVKTAGVVEPLRRALESRAKAIRAAFVYGSVSKGEDKAGSDIDLLVVSDSLGYPDIFEVLQRAERELARPVNPTVMTSSEWRAKRGRKDSFAARIAGEPKLFVIGSENELA